MTSIQYRLGVVGMPVAHSRSPNIHRQFAAQYAHSIDYQKFAIDAEHFAPFVQQFFTDGGHGLNVTLPYKQRALLLCSELSEAARIAGSVNTLYRNATGEICGDTTDGAGLLLDLQRHGVALRGKTVLLVGAGGAAQAALVALLGAGATVTIANRSRDKADALISRFAHLGEIGHFNTNATSIDLLVSSVSEFNSSLFTSFRGVLNSDSFIYDLNYGERAEPLRQFAAEAKVGSFADGWGMLVGQAAYSYQRWTGQLPAIDRISEAITGAANLD